MESLCATQMRLVVVSRESCLHVLDCSCACVCVLLNKILRHDFGTPVDWSLQTHRHAIATCPWNWNACMTTIIIILIASQVYFYDCVRKDSMKSKWKRCQIAECEIRMLRSRMQAISRLPSPRRTAGHDEARVLINRGRNRNSRK